MFRDGNWEDFLWFLVYVVFLAAVVWLCSEALNVGPSSIQRVCSELVNAGDPDAYRKVAECVRTARG